MRRCYRRKPTLNITVELNHRKKSIDTGAAVDTEWKNFRQTVAGQAWAAVLAECTGARERCMYCSDSKAVEIEHYRPKERFQSLAFEHKNHLYICTPCNRSKGVRFPVDQHGKPLLINPFEDDPWSALFVETNTGVIVPRYLPTGEDPRGIKSLELLAPLGSSAAEIGRAKSARRLRKAAQEVVRQGIAAGPGLLEAVDEDDYDMASWFLLWEGRDRPEFFAVRSQHGRLHRSFARRVVRKRQGVC